MESACQEWDRRQAQRGPGNTTGRLGVKEKWGGGYFNHPMGPTRDGGASPRSLVWPPVFKNN